MTRRRNVAEVELAPAPSGRARGLKCIDRDHRVLETESHRCKVCGAPAVESEEFHDDRAEPYCLRHLKALDPLAAELPEHIADNRS